MRRNPKNTLNNIVQKIIFFLVFIGIFAIILYYYVHLVEPYWVQTNFLEIHDSKILGEPKRGTRVVAFGDIHIGMGIGEKDLIKLVKRVNALSPDVVVFLGDLFDNYSTFHGDLESCEKILRGLRAPIRLAVRGNHDIGGGAQNVYPEIISKCGFTLLEDQEYMLECGIHIFGALDSLYFNPDVILGSGFDLLLSHEPDLALELDEGAELQISGHSHGGQVYIPFLTKRILPKGSKTYFRGEYENPKGGVIYVNRGYGMSLLPVRLFSRPEITIIDFYGKND